MKKGRVGTLLSLLHKRSKVSYKYVPLVIANSVGELDEASPSEDWLGFVEEENQWYKYTSGEWVAIDPPSIFDLPVTFDKVATFNDETEFNQLATFIGDCNHVGRVNFGDKVFVKEDRGYNGTIDVAIGTFVFTEGILTSFTPKP